MNKYLPYKISKLLSAYKTDSLSATEAEELSVWRKENVKNEELFQKIIHTEGFEQFRLQYEEYDMLPKFALFEQHIKQNKHKKIIKYLSYAAVMLPLIFAVWGIIHNQKQTIIPQVEYSSITPNRLKAILTIGEDKTIYIGADTNPNITNIDSNILIKHNTLQYKKNIQSTNHVLHRLKIPRGGEFFVRLSDGTNVWLNSESELKYADKFTGTERRVYLTGEAYFEVAHNINKPFWVESGNLQIQVLGTSFCVRAYKDENYALTTLEKGQVNIHSGTHTISLAPGEQAKLENKKLTVHQVNTQTYTSWKNGKYIFINESLENIMTTLARWYDFYIFYSSPQLRHIQFTGELIRYKNIEELLNKFEVLEKVKFEIKNDTITIKEY